MLRADGREEAAAAADRDALAVLGGIVREGGERRVWSGYQSTLWTTLLAASDMPSVRDADRPLPPFGWSITGWSPDLRKTYSEENPAVADRRRLAVRTAVRVEWRGGTRWAQRCFPVFDDSVAAARACPGSGDSSGAELLAGALTDRAGLAAADGRFEAALVDLTEALRTRTERA